MIRNIFIWLLVHFFTGRRRGNICTRAATSSSTRVSGYRGSSGWNFRRVCVSFPICKRPIDRLHGIRSGVIREPEWISKGPWRTGNSGIASAGHGGYYCGGLGPRMGTHLLYFYFQQGIQHESDFYSIHILVIHLPGSRSEKEAAHSENPQLPESYSSQCSQRKLRVEFYRSMIPKLRDGILCIFLIQRISFFAMQWRFRKSLFLFLSF